ncbi:MAG: DUF4922 domain-containing protein [Acidobacteria bacterium]|nr:DUF4922 domain-containing protein [Acidobacteriota bacterium]
MKNWDHRLLQAARPSTSGSPNSADALSGPVSYLLKQQRESWGMLRSGEDALAEVISKRLSAGGHDIIAQFNPRRIISTAARVDRTSIEQRPCFLCVDHLPPEEMGIPFGDEWVVLCNPSPIRPNHLSIVYRDHVPQAIAGRMETLLDLSRALGSAYLVLYNGPECGASAPDHLHLQACARDGLPVDAHIRSLAGSGGGKLERVVLAAQPELEVFVPRPYYVQLIVARSRDRGAIGRWFSSMMARLRDLTAHPSEPLINLVVVFDDPVWTVYLYPRGKHRPDRFFIQGPEQLTVSPASLDMAGILVVPIEAHFDRLSAEVAGDIYAEVTLPEEWFSVWLTVPPHPGGTGG